MRSLLTSLFSRESDSEANGRPEALRRHAITVNSRIMLAASALSIPLAIFYLINGAVTPFVCTIIGLGGGFISSALCRKMQYERAAFTQIYGVLLVGLVMTLVDPNIVDFGLAIALMAPVQSSLLSRTVATKRAWVLVVVVITAGCLGALGLLQWAEPNHAEYPLYGATVFTIIALSLAYAASQMSMGYAVFERGQINAYKHLLENVQDSVLRFSADGTVIFTAKSAEKLFGCRRWELSGNGLIDRIHVLDRPAYMTSFAESNRDGKTRRVEVRMRRDHPDEPARVPEFFWVEIALTPIIDAEADAERHEVVAVLRDVTERHAHEVEMREARRAAEDSSNAKSRFLATIGHELRTPLNAIVGFSEMMTSGVVGDLAPAHKEYAQIINQSGNHLLELVKMLLDMSRLEAGKFELTPETFDPRLLADPCFKIVEPMARERGIHLVAEMPKLLPQLVGDERALRQVVINLLSNAVKFSHDKGVVTLSMKRQGNMLNISVADRGIGMDSEAVSRIGEPFFQAQDGLARRYEGTGLGLSIVKGLVGLHDGTLKAVSSPGQGTTFTVLLPLNGPATKQSDTAKITPLVRESVVVETPQWQDEKRRAL